MAAHNLSEHTSSKPPIGRSHGGGSGRLLSPQPGRPYVLVDIERSWPPLPNLDGRLQVVSHWRGIELATRAGNVRGGLPYSVVLGRRGYVLAICYGQLDQTRLAQVVEAAL